MKPLYIHVSEIVHVGRELPRVKFARVVRLAWPKRVVIFVEKIEMTWVPSLARSPADNLLTNLFLSYGLLP